MPRFRFRLAASLRLAEQKLEEVQRQLAQEIRLRDEIEARRMRQEKIYQEGIEGQRKAIWYEPDKLGYWQKYLQKQIEILRLIEIELEQQEKRVEEARNALLKAHQECEKFRRLKAKQWLLFKLEEQRKEQAVLDEAGQVIHFRHKKLETEHSDKLVINKK